MSLGKKRNKTYSQSKDGYYVNLGIGIPTLVANYVRTDIAVEFQSEMVFRHGSFSFEVRKMLISLTQETNDHHFTRSILLTLP
jgi:acyl CoA:acetate/3-ketoacid CoA transferase beta subunit